MKIKSKKVISEIIKKVLNESPMMYDPHQSTIQSRMYKNQLKQGEHILKYPSQREIDHEMMRLNTLFVPRPAQYKLRLTKITNPQKMYDAYVSILSWKKKNPQYDDLLDDILDNVRYYLRKNGYAHMLAGRGGRAVKVENKRINENNQNFMKMLENFLNHPWQEDKEIEFVDLINDYYIKNKNKSEYAWKNYLNNLYKTNINILLQRTSDNFQDSLESLISNKGINESQYDANYDDSEYGNKELARLAKDIKKKFPHVWIKPGGDFDSDSKNSLWTGEGSEIDGYPAFDHYDTKEILYTMGVHKKLEKFLQSRGYFAEPYDAGTYFIYKD